MDILKYLECDFYTIVEMGGKKMVHILGFVYCAEGSCTNNEDEIYRGVEVSDLYFPLDEFLSMDKNEIWDIAGEHTQYIDDLTEEKTVEKMQQYFDGEPVVEMPFGNLTMDTPEGNYVDYEAA